MRTPREIADEFNASWLAVHPFEASYMGVPGYDGLVPDASADAAARWRASVEATRAAAVAFATGELSAEDAVTLACVASHADAEVAELDAAAVEHTVTAMPFSGPAELLAVASRSVLPDAEAASSYLDRLRASAAWVDQVSDRLRDGSRSGRLPVAPLVANALEWIDDVLREDVPGALATPSPPEGWHGATAWRETRDSVVSELVKPALSRWADLLRELLPVSRPGERAGLVHLPGGGADYERAVLAHTTLPLTAEEIHRTGLEELERLESRAAELGAGIGLGGIEPVREALRSSAGRSSPGEAMREALAAVRRAESRLAEAFAAPFPEPCEVSAMPHVVGASGMAPHYTPPRLDGSRAGTYWFNTDVATAGTGFDLEGVAFHEAVPGHHLQFSRLQALSYLSDMQRQRYVTVFSEGWALYAEQLAEEMGLYSSTEALLGATSASLLRAARLVVDTGIHAFGWGRDEALAFFRAHVPMPDRFLASEIDRYIVSPGQALAYLVGKLEILRARDLARERLGERFDLRRFHSAVLDSGSLPMPAMHANLARWAAALP